MSKGVEFKCYLLEIRILVCFSLLLFGELGTS